MVFGRIKFTQRSVAVFCEIGGGYVVWLWLREVKPIFCGLVGGVFSSNLTNIGLREIQVGLAIKLEKLWEDL